MPPQFFPFLAFQAQVRSPFSLQVRPLYSDYEKGVLTLWGKGRCVSVRRPPPLDGKPVGEDDGRRGEEAALAPFCGSEVVAGLLLDSSLLQFLCRAS